MWVLGLVLRGWVHPMWPSVRLTHRRPHWGASADRPLPGERGLNSASTGPGTRCVRPTRGAQARVSQRLDTSTESLSARPWSFRSSEVLNDSFKTSDDL